jgi:hypothetical protein
VLSVSICWKSTTLNLGNSEAAVRYLIGTGDFCDPIPPYALTGGCLSAEEILGIIQAIEGVPID